MCTYTRRRFLNQALYGLCASTLPIGTLLAQTEEYADPALAETWFEPLFTTKAIGSPFKLQKFLDRFYVLTDPIDWQPNPKAKNQENYKAVIVPKGFVTDLASIPRVFWSMLDPADDYAYAAVVHDYLYWEQYISKETADSILNFAMMDLEVSPVKRLSIYAAVDNFGSGAWKKNATLKRNGERRIIKKLPPTANIKWTDWKLNMDIY